MNGLLASLKNVENELTQTKGEFALFAAFSAADSPDDWDLVVSAPWAPRHRTETLRLFVDALDRQLSPADRLTITRVVVVEPSDRDVQQINTTFETENEVVEVSGEEHFGYFIARGYVIASHDYWRFLKVVFPSNAEFDFYTKDFDLHISVSWNLGDDPARPFKQSRIIIIRISRESLLDYLYIDSPRRHEAERKLAAYVREKLRTFNPQHSEPRGRVPPIERWDIRRDVFRSAVA
jgi:hypothetical protein